MNFLTIKNITILALVISAIITTILSLTSKKDVTVNTAETALHQDGFMEGVVAIRMNMLGLPASTLYAEKLTHFPQNNTTHLTSPHFVILAKKGSPWNIYADQGISEQGIDKLLLWGNVKIHQSLSALNKESTLLTSTLTVFPKSNKAETDQDVTVLQKNSVVKAKGLKADFNTNRVELLSQSRGTYDPNK